MRPAPSSPPAERTEELRLALVMNGGVSLAVWMGGVAFELNRLVRETHPVYRGLLELTGTAARIDVISGTSAGGVNGAALALAQLHDRSLYSLRDVWLEAGGLDTLLHEPGDDPLRSLMRGDEVFLPQIRKAFGELAQGSPARPEQVPLILNLTTTLLDALPHKALDDFGAVIEDSVHRARWHFEHLPGGPDDFEDRRIVDQLAFAARSSASFPVAFEPALFDPAGPLFGPPGPAPQPPRRRLRADAPLQGPAYLMDGGILDNKPFDAALRGIERLPAYGNTRRVLAYVVPDPAVAARPRPSGEDGRPAPPTLAEAAWRSLVEIPGAQSIASHMAALRQHNDAAARRWKRLVGAVQHMPSPVLCRHARDSLAAYRARRIDGIVDYFLEETERALSTAPDATMRMRRATRRWLASTWRETAEAAVRGVAPTPAARPSRESWLQAEIARHWSALLPTDFDAACRLSPARRWSWGLYTLEFVADLAVELLRRTQRLRGVVQAVAGAGRSVPPTLPPAAEANGDDLAADRLPSPARRQAPSAASRLADTRLSELWNTAYGLRERIAEARSEVNEAVGRTGGEGFVALVQAWTQQGGERPPRAEALSALLELLDAAREPGEPVQAWADEALRVFEQLRTAVDDALAPWHEAPERADLAEAVAELRALRDHVYGQDPAAPLEPREALLQRVLALEVIEVTAASRRRVPGAQAEVVQISARQASAFGGPDDPALKLNGMQLAHFGAFYKRSWRANDWTWGRLDGIDRAVRLALNPDALQRRFALRASGPPARAPVAAEVRGYLKALAVDTADEALRPILSSSWEADADGIERELQWLDQPATVPPPVLALCARALTRRLQLEALCRELPEIATSLRQEAGLGAQPAAEPTQALLARVPLGAPPDPQHAIDLVRRGLLGTETLAMQVGTDHFTRLATRGLATTQAALASRHGGLGALTVVVRLIEWPLRVLHWLGGRLAQDSSTTAALEAMALGVGGTLVVAAGVSEKMPGALVAFGWALLAGSVGVSLLRSVAWGGLLASAVAVLLAVTHPASAWAMVAVVVGLLLLRWRATAPLVAAAAVLGAAWWSAGASPDAAALWWQRTLAPGPSPVPPDKSDVAAQALWQAYERLDAALWPALAVAVLILLGAGSRPAARALRRWRSR